MIKIDNDNNIFSQIWEVMFKINNLLLPFFIAWAVWTTNEIYQLKAFREQGPRFTGTDAKNLELNVKQWTTENFVDIKTRDNLISDIKDIKRSLDIMKDGIYDIKVKVSYLDGGSK